MRVHKSEAIYIAGVDPAKAVGEERDQYTHDDQLGQSLRLTLLARRP